MFLSLSRTQHKVNQVCPVTAYFGGLEHRASRVKESLLSFTGKTQIILRQPQPDDEGGGTAAGNSAREIENLITR